METKPQERGIRWTPTKSIVGQWRIANQLAKTGPEDLLNPENKIDESLIKTIKEQFGAEHVFHWWTRPSNNVTQPASWFISSNEPQHVTNLWVNHPNFIKDVCYLMGHSDATGRPTAMCTIDTEPSGAPWENDAHQITSIQNLGINGLMYFPVASEDSYSRAWEKQLNAHDAEELTRDDGLVCGLVAVWTEEPFHVSSIEPRAFEIWRAVMSAEKDGLKSLIEAVVGKRDKATDTIRKSNLKVVDAAGWLSA